MEVKIVAISVAGDQYDVYLRSLEEAIIAIVLSDNPDAALLDCEHRLQNALALTQNMRSKRKLKRGFIQ